jgi:hypothetical protein
MTIAVVRLAIVSIPANVTTSPAAASVSVTAEPAPARFEMRGCAREGTPEVEMPVTKLFATTLTDSTPPNVEAEGFGSIAPVSEQKAGAAVDPVQFANTVFALAVEAVNAKAGVVVGLVILTVNSGEKFALETVVTVPLPPDPPLKIVFFTLIDGEPLLSTATKENGPEVVAVIVPMACPFTKFPLKRNCVPAG